MLFKSWLVITISSNKNCWQIRERGLDPSLNVIAIVNFTERVFIISSTSEARIAKQDF